MRRSISVIAATISLLGGACVDTRTTGTAFGEPIALWSIGGGIVRRQYIDVSFRGIQVYLSETAELCADLDAGRRTTSTGVLLTLAQVRHWVDPIDGTYVVGAQSGQDELRASGSVFERDTGTCALDKDGALQLTSGTVHVRGLDAFLAGERALQLTIDVGLSDGGTLRGYTMVRPCDGGMRSLDAEWNGGEVSCAR